MSGLYYRRWTRMYIHPAAKYFKQYGLIQPGMQHLWHLDNKQNPFPENKRFYRRTLVDHEKQINNKLIQNLFNKYPDLKYESINRQKYQGDNFNSYSYSFAFITQQKKLMKSGYTMQKAFQIVQEKFQQKMKRKLDQTLISRGLAIGNRARSLLTIYQQQVEYQSRLKMLRTKRQVLKYERQLKEIQDAVNKPVSQQQQSTTEQYERIFQKITETSNAQLNKQNALEKRPQMVARIQKDFQGMFTQFYQTAAYKDRLRGLTDQQIKQEIMTSPSKIKRLSKQLVKFLKSKGDISISLSGQLKMNENINEKLKSFIYSSPTIKIAILNHLLGYESPQYSARKRIEMQAKNKLASLKNLYNAELDQQAKTSIKQNKIRQFEQVVEKGIPQDNRAYRLLQSAQERMLRLQIKYLSSFIKNSEKSEDNVFEQLKNVIDKFRRLKFRMEKRHKNLAKGDMAFPEHYAFNKSPQQIQDVNAQYEDLLEYLRKKTEERRLKAIDQVDDNKINELMQKQAYKETPKAEGQEHRHN